MLLRICLIIAVVGSLAAGVVNFVQVKKVITTTISQRDDEKKQKVAALADASKTKATLKTTTATLETTRRDLTQTKSQLTDANAKVADLQKQTEDLTSDLKTARDARDKFDQQLSKWTQLGVTPQQVVQTIADLKRITVERDVYDSENRMMNKKIGELTNELAGIVGNNNDVPALPQGLRGKVVSVDPKYAFVVLNIGEDSSVVRRGIMLVARGDKFIGKVQIDRVESTNSVANVIPSWSQGQIMEGDQVWAQ